MKFESGSAFKNSFENSTHIVTIVTSTILILADGHHAGCLFLRFWRLMGDQAKQRLMESDYGMTKT